MAAITALKRSLLMIELFLVSLIDFSQQVTLDLLASLMKFLDLVDVDLEGFLLP